MVIIPLFLASLSDAVFPWCNWVDDGVQNRLGEGDELVGDPVGDHLLGYQAFTDFDFFQLGVAGDLDHLHSVQQRRVHRVERVGRCHEEDLREVKRRPR